MTVTIEGADEPAVNPIARDDSATVSEDGPAQTIDLLANDEDPQDGTPSLQSIDTAGTQGTVTDNGDGTVDYDPNGQFEALIDGETATDSFSYTVVDSDGNTASADVTVTIEGADEPAVQGVAVDQAGTIAGEAGPNNFIVQIDNTNGATVTNPDFEGQATLDFEPGVDTLIFQNVSGSTVTEADFFTDPNNVGDDLFDAVTEDTFGPSVNFIFGIDPVIGGAGAQVLVPGVGELDADNDQQLDFVEFI